MLSGHIKGTSGGVFRGLSDVVVGDEVWLYTTDGRTLHYVVDEALLLRETGEDLAQRAANARYMDPTDDTRLTLITCWPDWAYTHRVVCDRPGRWWANSCAGGRTEHVRILPRIRTGCRCGLAARFARPERNQPIETRYAWAAALLGRQFEHQEGLYEPLVRADDQAA